jgi:hypothetical protein
VEIPAALPVATAPPEPPAHACRKPSRATARGLEREVEARWRLADPDASLHIDFGCDSLAPRIRELVFETSDRDRLALRLDRVRPRKDGNYDLLRLEYTAQVDPFGTVTPDPWELVAAQGGTVRVGVLPGKRFEPALRRMRAALQLQIEERSTEEITTSPASSGRDFHVAHRLVDVDGHGAAGLWTGHAGPEEQATWLPFDLAAEAYAAVAWGDDVERSLVTRKPGDDDRDFFVTRFVAARDRDPAYGAWYVRERLLAMARELGDVRLAVDLLDIARQSGEPEVARSQAAAVDALVRLTGHETRYERGDPRAAVDAAADMIRTCG